MSFESYHYDDINIDCGSEELPACKRVVFRDANKDAIIQILKALKYYGKYGDRSTLLHDVTDILEKMEHQDDEC